MINLFAMRSEKSAFTLVETLVSLFVLSTALTGTFAVISFNLSSAAMIKNSFIASGLAQEGLEVMRNLRDNDWHLGRDFGSFGNPDGPVPDGAYCVQWDSLEIINPCSDANLVLDDGGMYLHGSVGTPSIFDRKIIIQSVPGDPVAEIVVQSVISWNEKSGLKEMYAEEHLFNWY